MVSEYQMFVKQNMKRIMEENPGSPQKDIMGLLGKSYRENKSRGSPEELKVESAQTSIISGDVELVAEKLDTLNLTGP